MLKKRIVRAAAAAAVALGIALVALTVYVARTWDRTWDAPLPNLQASADPAVIKRGEYLVFGPSHCVDCHSASPTAAQEAADRGERPALVGGQPFALAPLGVIYSANLTPDPETGIGRYTDPQIARLLRYAVRPNGRATARPLMAFDSMSDDDMTAVISYLRSQPPVRHAVPQDQYTLVGKIVKSFAPTFKPRTDVRPYAATPEERPTRERGEYLARAAANCGGCHSPRTQLTFAVNGPEFSGGNAMEPAALPDADPTIWFRPPNITPATQSALSKFPDRETFVARFQRGGRHHAGSPMPWECFGRMSTNDIGALYEFLHSLPAAGEATKTTFRKTS